MSFCTLISCQDWCYCTTVQHTLSFLAECECDKSMNQEECCTVYCLRFIVNFNKFTAIIYKNTLSFGHSVWMVGVVGSWWFWHFYVLVQVYIARSQNNENGCGGKRVRNESWSHNIIWSKKHQPSTAVNKWKYHSCINNKKKITCIRLYSGIEGYVR